MKRTGYLFSEPSFINGIARLLDFGSMLDRYNESESAEEADCRALKSDWKAVGDDMWKAIEGYGRK